MNSRADEALRSAIRRSLPILIGLIVLGVVVSNLYAQSKGPTYQSVSQVEVSATPLSTIITGTQPGFADPQRSQDTALALASSPQLYQLASRDAAGRLGSAGDLQSATSVAGVPDTDILSFTSTASLSRRATATANTVAEAYVAFRASLSAASVSSTITKLQQTLATIPFSSPQHFQVQQELNRVRLLQGASSSDSTVIQRAVSADQTAPSLVKDSVIGLSVGLVVALLLIGLREAVDTTVRSESDVEDALGRPVLASVRRLPRRQKIVTYGRYESGFADAYALLAAQLSPPEDADVGSVLAVTSALSREGKTTTAVNLAVAAARRGTKVLLADFDFRKSELSRLFPLPQAAPGALQVLSGHFKLDDVLWSVSLDTPKPEVYRTGEQPAQVPRVTSDNGGRALGTLALLPAGGVLDPRHASERPAMAPLVHQMRDWADLIVIDTPPALLTAEMTELAGLIDLALVVVRQGRLSRRNLRSLARHTRSWHSELAGVVLTDVPPLSGAGTYYGAR